jgi:hypothetical protein
MELRIGHPPTLFELWWTGRVQGRQVQSAKFKMQNEKWKAESTALKLQRVWRKRANSKGKVKDRPEAALLDLNTNSDQIMTSVVQPRVRSAVRAALCAFRVS